MKYLGPMIAALAIAAAFDGTPARANVCQADTLTCSTAMPVDGYCECHARGQTEGGTVVAAPARGQRMNSTSGGCGVAPNSPGCR